jgi:hypothetical protein
MALRVFSQLMVCGVLIAWTGCRTTSRERSEEPSNANAIVIRSGDMSGTILQTLRTRIPSIRISTDGERCPVIMFRGNLSMRNQPAPSIYIDGTLTADSCVLDHVAGHDVDRIEVYPSGDTPHSQIRRNASGVILIYRRRE